MELLLEAPGEWVPEMRPELDREKEKSSLLPCPPAFQFLSLWPNLVENQLLQQPDKKSCKGKPLYGSELVGGRGRKLRVGLGLVQSLNPADQMIQ